MRIKKEKGKTMYGRIQASEPCERNIDVDIKYANETVDKLKQMKYALELNSSVHLEGFYQHGTVLYGEVCYRLTEAKERVKRLKQEKKMLKSKS